MGRKQRIVLICLIALFFNDTATTEIYTRTVKDYVSCATMPNALISHFT